jgi:hypothetical protein
MPGICNDRVADRDAARRQSAPKHRKAPIARAGAWRFRLGGSKAMPSSTRRNVADYSDNKDPRRERYCIAEIDGDNLGCTLQVKDPEVAARAGSNRG